MKEINKLETLIEIYIEKAYDDGIIPTNVVINLDKKFQEYKGSITPHFAKLFIENINRLTNIKKENDIGFFTLLDVIGKAHAVNPDSVELKQAIGGFKKILDLTASFNKFDAEEIFIENLKIVTEIIENPFDKKKFIEDFRNAIEVESFEKVKNLIPTLKQIYKTDYSMIDEFIKEGKSMNKFLFMELRKIYREL